MAPRGRGKPGDGARRAVVDVRAREAGDGARRERRRAAAVDTRARGTEGGAGHHAGRRWAAAWGWQVGGTGAAAARFCAALGGLRGEASCWAWASASGQFVISNLNFFKSDQILNPLRINQIHFQFSSRFKVLILSKK